MSHRHGGPDREPPKIPAHGGVYVDDVVVSRREHRLEHADELLIDPPYLCARRIHDGEVPGAPVLRFDLPDGVVRRIDEIKRDLSKHVLLDNFSHGAATSVLDPQLRLEHLRGPGDLEDHLPVGVVDRETVSQELINVGYEPECLSHLALALLLDAAESSPLGVRDGVLINQLDQLGLLTHHESVGSQEVGHVVSPIQSSITSTDYRACR